MQTPQSQSASSSQRRRAQPWGSAVGEVGLQRQFAGQACSSLAQEKGSQWPSAPQRASGPQGSVSAAVQGRRVQVEADQPRVGKGLHLAGV